MTDHILPPYITENFNRNTFPGKKRIESVQHTILAPGMALERSIADAQMWIKDGMKYLEDQIKHQLDKLLHSITMQFPLVGRIIKCIKDIIQFVKDMIEFIKEIIGLIQAVIAIIGFLQGMIASIVAMAQRILNAIATLINQICSLRLPPLPSIPNLFGGLYFDGFQFPKGAFHFSLHFDANFAFGSCRRPVMPFGPGVFQNYPDRSVRLGMDPSGTFQLSPVTMHAPLLLAYFRDDADAINAAHPNDPPIAASPTTPIFSNDWVPMGGYDGALPVPTAISEPYALPVVTFGTNAIALLPNSDPIIADNNPVGTTSPSRGLPAAIDGLEATLQPAVRAFCVQNVTLGNIIPAGWDTGDTSENPNWVVAWAWLAYIYQCRMDKGLFGTTTQGRNGLWIPAFQDAFEAHVLPGYNDILATPVPWNDAKTPMVFDEATSTMVVNQRIAPWSMVFTSTLNLPINDPPTLLTILWKLSYVEAALLGYQRNTRWDLGATSGFIDGPTGADLDYRALVAPSGAAMVDIRLDSHGKADYPSGIKVHQALLANMQAAITRGYQEICAHPEFRAKTANLSYVYDEFASTIEINAHSQYWKTWRANWDALCTQDPEVQAIVWNYPEILWQAMDPMASDGQEAYNRVKNDVAHRNAGFIPGTPFLPTPSIPTLMVVSADPDPKYFLPTGSPNGWGGLGTPGDHNMVTGTPMAPGSFDAVAFMNRPDIKQLPWNYQNKMLFLNQAWADTRDNYDAVLTEIVGQQQASYDAAASALDNAMGYMDIMDTHIAYAQDNADAMIAFRMTQRAPVLTAGQGTSVITYTSGDIGDILIRCTAGGITTEAHALVGTPNLDAQPVPPPGGPTIVVDGFVAANTAGLVASASGGTGPYTWEVKDGTLAALQELSATLKAPGTFSAGDDPPGTTPANHRAAIQSTKASMPNRPGPYTPTWA